MLPLIVVIFVNFMMALIILPRIDFSFLAAEPWRLDVGGGRSVSVLIALTAASLTLIIVHYQRLSALRESLDAGANSSVLPIMTVASLVGFALWWLQCQHLRSFAMRYCRYRADGSVAGESRQNAFVRPYFAPDFKLFRRELELISDLTGDRPD